MAPVPCLLANQAGIEAHGLRTARRNLSRAPWSASSRASWASAQWKPHGEALAKAGLTLEDMDHIELNEAFAAQSLACTRSLGLADDDPRVNPQGGAIALGHPLGMTGARILLTAARQLARNGGRYALVTLCIGVGQGYATILRNPNA